MINFHTITLNAQELCDPETGLPKPETFCNPVEILFSQARAIDYYEGDSVEVLLTDGTRYVILYEDDLWTSCQYIPKKQMIDPADNVHLITLYGPYEILEEALDDLVSKRNYLSVN